MVITVKMIAVTNANEKCDYATRKHDRLITEAERAIELFQERGTALISAAVTGKIDVREFMSEEAVA